MKTAPILLCLAVAGLAILSVNAESESSSAVDAISHQAARSMFASATAADGDDEDYDEAFNMHKSRGRKKVLRQGINPSPKKSRSARLRGLFEDDKLKRVTKDVVQQILAKGLSISSSSVFNLKRAQTMTFDAMNNVIEDARENVETGYMTRRQLRGLLPQLRVERLLYLLAHEFDGHGRAIVKDIPTLKTMYACSLSNSDPVSFRKGCKNFWKFLMQQMSSGEWFYRPCEYRHWAGEDLVCLIRLSPLVDDSDEEQEDFAIDDNTKVDMFLAFDKQTFDFRLSWEGYPRTYRALQAGRLF